MLRRGYIGSNKNAYFMRAMVGKRNAIPLDKERTAMDDKFQSLIEEGKEDEIPESDYPQQEWDRYPLPVWKQDEDVGRGQMGSAPMGSLQISCFFDRGTF